MAVRSPPRQLQHHCERAATTHRPITFLRHHKRVVRGSIDECRLEKEAALVSRSSRRGSADYESSPAAQCVLDMRARSGADTFVQNWAIGDARINPMTELDSPRLGSQSVNEFRVNHIRNQNAIHRDADLPHVGEGAARRGRRRFRDVSIAENDERAMAAEFHVIASMSQTPPVSSTWPADVEAVAVIIRTSGCEANARGFPPLPRHIV